jgi:hypothetical protein
MSELQWMSANAAVQRRAAQRTVRRNRLLGGSLFVCTMHNRRRCSTPDDCRSLLNKSIVLERSHHEEGEINTACPVVF